MLESKWIPIGRGDDKSKLEQMVIVLRERWERRWEFRIDHDEDQVAEPYRLMVRHV